MNSLALPPPTVRVEPSTPHVCAGCPLIITCNVSVAEHLAVQPIIDWIYPNGTIIHSDSNNPATTAINETGSGTVKELVFDPVVASHRGQYKCKVTIRIPQINLEETGEDSSNVTVLRKSTTKM